MARLASGGRYGFAQSVFQVGGNAGQAISPLLVALLIIPNGQHYIGLVRARAPWSASSCSTRVGYWYRDHLAMRRTAKATAPAISPVARNRVIAAVAVLLALTFSKNFYMAAFASYYTFFLIDRFAVSVGSAADPPVPVPGCGRRRHVDRRPDRRPDRPQADLVDLDPGRAAAAPWRCRSPTCSGPTCWRC